MTGKELLKGIELFRSYANSEEFARFDGTPTPKYDEWLDWTKKTKISDEFRVNIIAVSCLITGN